MKDMQRSLKVNFTKFKALLWFFLMPLAGIWEMLRYKVDDKSTEAVGAVQIVLYKIRADTGQTQKWSLVCGTLFLWILLMITMFGHSSSKIDTIIHSMEVSLAVLYYVWAAICFALHVATEVKSVPYDVPYKLASKQAQLSSVQVTLTRIADGQRIQVSGIGFLLLVCQLYTGDEEEEEEEEEETMSKNEFVQWHKYQRGRAPSGDEMDQFHAMDVKGDGQIKMADFEKSPRRSSSMLPVKEECGECDDCEEEKEVKAGEQLGAGKDTKPESSEDSSPAQMLHYATPDGGQSETAVADISQHISEGAITPETQIWIDGLADWMPLLEAQQAGEMTALRAVMKAADSDVKRAYLAQVWPLAGGDGGPVGEEGLLAVLLQMGFEPEEFEIGFVLAQVRSDLPPQPIPILLNHCGRVCRSTQTTTRP